LIIRKLQVENFRNLAAVDIEPHARLNYFEGANGAGKTSVLEALVVLSRGRSFRTTQAAELVGPVSETFRVFAVAEQDQGQSHRLGLERSGKRWRGRKDGADLSQLSQLTRSLPLILMEPDSHLLVSGPPEVRRRFVDWGMFHVEPGFLDTWRRFSKALKQRNAALRGSQRDVLDSLDEVVAAHGEQLGAYRRAHCASIASGLQPMLAELNSGLSGIAVDYHEGWSGGPYLEQLRSSRTRDLDRGMTMSGPHRADLQLVLDGAPARAILSRGEQKVLAAAMLLTQAELVRACGERPLLLLDDLASEFDHTHFDNVLRRALSMGGQVWVTGTRQVAVAEPLALFHVEQGLVQEVV
jgi:DNA replication and repair protein RecF